MFPNQIHVRTLRPDEALDPALERRRENEKALTVTVLRTTGLCFRDLVTFLRGSDTIRVLSELPENVGEAGWKALLAVKASDAMDAMEIAKRQLHGLA